jgi:phosphotriesterase-related protein
VIKVAGSQDGLQDHDVRAFEAAAIAHARTGVPILTHCERGTGALEQVRFLLDRGVEPGHIALSHVDMIVDRGLHRELLASGVFAEYDQTFRWPAGADNGTVRLIGWMAEDGLADRIVLGMDAARRRYYTVFGGAPGLTWLLDGFTGQLEAAGLGAGIRHRLFVDNPLRLFSFAAATASDTA